MVLNCGRKKTTKQGRGFIGKGVLTARRGKFGQGEEEQKGDEAGGEGKQG